MPKPTAKPTPVDKKKDDFLRNSTSTSKDLYPVQLRFSNLSFKVPNPRNPNKQRKCPPCGGAPPAADAASSSSSGEDEEMLPRFAKDRDLENLWILDKVSGTVNPGEMLAIMGTSGAGKTSLLNLLAGRVTDGDISGKILLNGVGEAQAEHLRSHQTYIMQDDLMMGTQTPREILRFSARLRLPKGTTHEQAEKRVNRILKELNLLDCADTRVGTVGGARGISGGERKRTAIGLELVTNPSLLFVDEPTTGLDSTTALRVTQTLEALARAGRTVIATIHQPSSLIYACFDKVMLLSKGEVIYFGPRKEVLAYFDSVDRPVPKNSNPADHMLYTGWVDESEPESLSAVRLLAESYRHSAFKKKYCNHEALTLDKDVAKSLRKGKQSHTHEGESRGYQTNVFVQFKEIVLRHFRDLVREPMRIRAPLGQTLFMSLLIGFLYFQVGKGQSTAQDRLGSLFFILINQTMSGAFGTVTAFGEQRALFLREHSNRMYRTTSFYLGRTIGDLPFQTLNIVLFSTIVFWMIGYSNQADGLEAASMYFMYMLILVLMSNVAASMGWLLSIIAPNPGVALAITPLTLIPLMMFSGFYVNTENIPPYFVWVEALSPMRYAFEALSVTVMRGVEFDCDDDQRIPRGCVERNQLDDPAPDDPDCQCPLYEGKQLVDNFNFKEDNVWPDILVLVGFILFFRICCHWALTWVAQKSSNA